MGNQYFSFQTYKGRWRCWNLWKMMLLLCKMSRLTLKILIGWSSSLIWPPSTQKFLGASCTPRFTINGLLKEWCIIAVTIDIFKTYYKNSQICWPRENNFSHFVMAIIALIMFGKSKLNSYITFWLICRIRT